MNINNLLNMSDLNPLAKPWYPKGLNPEAKPWYPKGLNPGAKSWFPKWWRPSPPSNTPKNPKPIKRRFFNFDVKELDYYFLNTSTNPY